MVYDATQCVHSASELIALVALLAEETIPVTRVLRGTGLEPSDLANPETRVSIAQMIAAYRNATVLSNSTHIGLRLGLGTEVTMYGIYGFALLSSPTRRSACEFAQKYQALSIPLLVHTLTEDKGPGIWSTEPVVDLASDPKLYALLVEHAFGSLITFARDIADPDFVPVSVRLRFPEPESAAAYREAFRCPILFNQPHNQVVVDSRWLDGPTRRAHHAAFTFSQQLCDEMLENIAKPQNIGTQLRRLFIESAGKFPAIDKVCGRLGLGVRTLRRKLANEGTTYQALLDEVRLELAKKYLHETALTVDEIANRLNFSDASNFRHAFRRWSGTTPKDIRSGGFDR